MGKQVVNKIILPDIIKDSSQFDSKNFNTLLKNMALRVSLESSLVAVFEIVNFKHVEKISLNWGQEDFSEIILHPKIKKERGNLAKNVELVKNEQDRLCLGDEIKEKIQELKQKKERYYILADYYKKVRRSHILNVVFDKEYFYLKASEKLSLIKKIEENLKKARACYKLVKIPARNELDETLYNWFKVKKNTEINKDNYQMMINQFMPFGWGEHREGILISEMINNNLNDDQQKLIKDKNFKL